MASIFYNQVKNLVVKAFCPLILSFALTLVGLIVFAFIFIFGSIAIYLITGGDITIFVQYEATWLVVSIVVVVFILYQSRRKKGGQKEDGECRENGSKLKTWGIPLPFFHFHHEPYRRESSHSNFIGRNELSDKFLAIMKNSQNSSGSYLITGYRGVGKTSFVKKVLEDYKNGTSSISYSTRLSPFFKWVHTSQRWLLKYHGFFSLQFHKCVFNNNIWSRDNGKQSSALIKYSIIPVRAFNKEWRFKTFFAIILLYFIFSSPSDYTHVDTRIGIFYRHLS